MDNEKEISFGAFDSELMHQEIFIPKGFEATIEGDRIILKKIESEDERIRKSLIILLQHFCKGYRVPGLEFPVSYKDMLAWLEKQGEQKVPVVDFKAKDWYVSKVDGKIHNIYYSVDKPEPKFKVGDWVVLYPSEIEVNRKVVQISRIERCQLNMYWTTEGTWFGDGTDARLWTIQDAKNGDVLKEDSCTFIIERMKPDGTAIIHCCLFDDGDFDLGSTLGFDVDSTYPATKEQRDLLFQKMKESGYEWDDKEKELKKIEDEDYDGEDYGIDSLYHAQRILEKTLGSVDGYQTDDGILSHKCAITAVKKLYEHKPAEWSDEDEEQVSIITNIVKAHCGKLIDCRSNLSWIKSIKDRVQPKQEWSEEDQNALEDVREAVVNYWGGGTQDILLYWLKSLKQRIGG